MGETRDEDLLPEKNCGGRNGQEALDRVEERLSKGGSMFRLESRVVVNEASS